MPMKPVRDHRNKKIEALVRQLGSLRYRQFKLPEKECETSRQLCHLMRPGIWYVGGLYEARLVLGIHTTRDEPRTAVRCRIRAMEEISIEGSTATFAVKRHRPTQISWWWQESYRRFHFRRTKRGWKQVWYTQKVAA